jgi:hypothetical protein
MHISEFGSAHAGDVHGPEAPKTHVDPVTLSEAAISIAFVEPCTQTKYSPT